jgi:ABC-type branched-subunit amino acid transport system ATPase component
MTNALEISDLTLRYGAVQALTNVNVTVGSGEVVAVLGVNGAGKSSLLNTIAGLIRGNSGSILLEATPIAGVSAERIARMGVALDAGGASDLHQTNREGKPAARRLFSFKR